ncbi:MAG: hypothetical protein WBQ18_20785, partial [Solirubrobacteraceae bacterium]
MADGPERTAEEREAARQARERRRNGVFNEPELPPDPVPEADVADDGHAAAAPLPPEAPQYEAPQYEAPADETLPEEDLPNEAPVGTRRVSRSAGGARELPPRPPRAAR